MMFQMTDWYHGFEEDHELLFECELTERGWRGDSSEPGYGAEFEVTAVYLDGAPVYGAQLIYLIKSREDYLQETANEFDYATR